MTLMPLKSMSNPSHAYKLEQQLHTKSLEALKRQLVGAIYSVPENSKSKAGETQRQRDQRLSNLRRDLEAIPQYVQVLVC
jgi:hypothetical protein